MSFLDGLTSFLGFGVDDDVGNGRKNREDDVKRVKGALRESGHFPEDREITGIIDRETVDGIRQFQLEHGLRDDGLIKPEGETAKTLFRPKFKPETPPPLHVPGETRKDAKGFGEFGAPRGDRLHRGHDFLTLPGQDILAPATGTVTRFGFPYGDDREFRLVDIETDEGYKVKTFYVDPTIKVGDRVERGVSIIGKAQDLRKRFGRAMRPHVHIEVLDRQNKHIDPAPLVDWDSLRNNADDGR